MFDVCILFGIHLHSNPHSLISRQSYEHMFSFHCSNASTTWRGEMPGWHFDMLFAADRFGIITSPLPWNFLISCSLNVNLALSKRAATLWIHRVLFPPSPSSSSFFFFFCFFFSCSLRSLTWQLLFLIFSLAVSRGSKFCLSIGVTKSYTCCTRGYILSTKTQWRYPHEPMMLCWNRKHQISIMNRKIIAKSTGKSVSRKHLSLHINNTLT